jgi:hypothetical protein
MGWFDQERDKPGPSCPKERNIAEFLFGNTSDRDNIAPVFCLLFFFYRLLHQTIFLFLVKCL